jgi:hypothetical protein
MFRALFAEGAEFLLVGGYALASHGHARATGDLDLWVRPTSINAARVLRALRSFGAPLRGLTEGDLSRPGTIFQLGIPPWRIDILTSIEGVGFEGAWRRRLVKRHDDLEIPVLGRRDLIRNKTAVGRPQDLADVARLRGTSERRRRRP